MKLLSYIALSALVAFFFSPLPCVAAEQLVLIPGGSFIMGSPAGEVSRGKDEEQRHITLDSFYISKYEVTQKEYQDVTGSLSANFRGGTLPVENVTWYEAVRYCNERSIKEGFTPAYNQWLRCQHNSDLESPG